MVGLVHVDFNLTNACNLSCSHCHSASGAALPDELTTREIVAIIGQLHAHGVLSVAFAGGEPFVRRDIVAILSAACALDGWRVSVITNGLFFSDAMLGVLAEQCPGLGVNVSIDGSTPESFSELRAQPGASRSAKEALFRRVTEGVQRAVGAGLDVSVNTTMTRATMSDLVPTYAMATGRLGARSLVAIKFFPAGYGRAHLERFEFPSAVWSQQFQQLTVRKLAGDLPLMQLSLPSAWEFYLPLIEGGFDLATAERAWHNRSPLRESAYGRHRTVGDVAGVTELCVSGDGSVYPSVLMVGEERMRCGSLRESELGELWESAAPLRQLRDMRLSDISPACDGCDLARLCGGGSRSRALAQHGSPFAADSACTLLAAGLTEAAS
ncbi:radical SAM/SPASM domain-containing protein [Streptomyces sp. NPDC057654]|uniref:radical SAM/SPASM domain-containing protein n=1 Tax=Streptomyces sp. NPDC057654 TaxID=3346196 RepID=UPI003685B835